MPLPDTPDDRPTITSRALWYAAPDRLELRTETLPEPQAGEAVVVTHYSAISRGTERLVFGGQVPEAEHDRMRCPHQSGAFPFPVKYGYSAAGRVEQGPDDLVGQNVFCLFPHQDRFVVHRDWLVPLPANLPLKRATLAANMETALNAIWDGDVKPCDQIVVIGAGIVGLLTAFLAARIPGTEVTVVDTLAERASLAQALGLKFAEAGNATPGADVVFHTSASPRGLEAAISYAGFEATIVEMSWYGEKIADVPLGGAFHSQRLRIISSQVGHVASPRRARWPHARRAAAAVRLLASDELDRLVENEIAFDDIVDTLPAVFRADWAGMPPVIRYD